MLEAQKDYWRLLLEDGYNTELTHTRPQKRSYFDFDATMTPHIQISIDVCMHRSLDRSILHLSQGMCYLELETRGISIMTAAQPPSSSKTRLAASQPLSLENVPHYKDLAGSSPSCSSFFCLTALCSDPTIKGN